MTAATLFQSEAPAVRGDRRRGRGLAFLRRVPAVDDGNRAEAAGDEQAAHAEPPALTLEQYLQGLQLMWRQAEDAGVGETLGSVSPREVQALVEKVAKARGRYLAEVLETAELAGVPDPSRTERLARLRHDCEELRRGLEALLGDIRAERVAVDGVARPAS